MNNKYPKDEFTSAREAIDDCCQCGDMDGVKKALSNPNKIIAMYAARQIMEYDYVAAIPDLILYAEQFDWTKEYNTSQVHLFSKIVDFVNIAYGTSFQFSPNDTVVTMTKVLAEIKTWLQQNTV